MSGDHGVSFWATIESYRGLLLIDGELLAAYRNRNVGFDARLLGQIASEYRVSRTIPVVCPAQEVSLGRWGERWRDYHRQLIADALNRQIWKTGLVDRAHQCADLVKQLRDEMERTKVQGRKPTSFASAITKFSWFASPNGWTPYDAYAWTAVIGGQQEAVSAMLRFYEELSRRGFDDVLAEVRSISSRFPVSLYPEKIIDYYLMAVGAQTINAPPRWDLNNRVKGQNLLDHLPGSFRDGLTDMAIEIARVLDASGLARRAATSRRAPSMQISLEAI